MSLHAAEQLRKTRRHPEYETTYRGVAQRELAKLALSNNLLGTGGFAVVESEEGKHYVSLHPEELGRELSPKELERHGLPKLPGSEKAVEELEANRISDQPKEEPRSISDALDEGLEDTGTDSLQTESPRVVAAALAPEEVVATAPQTESPVEPAAIADALGTGGDAPRDATVEESGFDASLLDGETKTHETVKPLQEVTPEQVMDFETVSEALDTFAAALESPVDSYETRLQQSLDDFKEAFGALQYNFNPAARQTVLDRLDDFLGKLSREDLVLRLDEDLRVLLNAPVVRQELDKEFGGILEGDEAKQGEALHALEAKIRSRFTEFDAAKTDAISSVHRLRDALDNIPQNADEIRFLMQQTLPETVDEPRTLKDDLVRFVNEAKAAF